MKTLFNKKFEQLINEYGGPLDLQVNRQHGGTYTGSTDDDEMAEPSEEGEEGDEKSDKQKDIESLKALRANPDKKHAIKNYGSVEKYKKMLTRKINDLKANDENEEAKRGFQQLKGDKDTYGSSKMQRTLDSLL